MRKLPRGVTAPANAITTTIKVDLVAKYSAPRRQRQNCSNIGGVPSPHAVKEDSTRALSDIAAEKSRTILSPDCRG